MQKRLHKRGRKGKNVNVIIQGLVFQNKVYLTMGQCEFLIQFYSSAKGYICLHLSLLVLSHTEIKPNKTLAPVHALLHKKLNPRLTFKPELKSTPFRTTRPRIANMWQLNLLLQEQCRIQGRGPNLLLPSLFWVKKKGIAEGRKAGSPSDRKPPHPPLPQRKVWIRHLREYNFLNTFLVFALVNFSGTAGDSFSYHHGWPFSTPDEENDFKPTGNCALEYQGGWWFKWCHKAFLNGPYIHGPNPDHGEGNIWQHFRGVRYSLKSSQMKIRPRDF